MRSAPTEFAPMPRTDASAPPLVYNPQARVCLQCPVRRQALFGLLDAAELEAMHWRVADLSFNAGQTLFLAGEQGHAAYTVREGLVMLQRLSETGERRIVRLAGRGDLIGPEAVLGQSYATTAVAALPTRVCRLPKGLIDELQARSPELGRGLMARWQQALDDADEAITELGHGSARWRMLRLLLKLSEFAEGDGRVWLPTRQDMGALLGLTVETTSRLVSKLRREGLIQPDGVRHARVDMDALLGQLRAEAAVGR